MSIRLGCILLFLFLSPVRVSISDEAEEDLGRLVQAGIDRTREVNGYLSRELHCIGASLRIERKPDGSATLHLETSENSSNYLFKKGIRLRYWDLFFGGDSMDAAVPSRLSAPASVEWDGENEVLPFVDGRITAGFDRETGELILLAQTMVDVAIAYRRLPGSDRLQVACASLDLDAEAEGEFGDEYPLQRLILIEPSYTDMDDGEYLVAVWTPKHGTILSSSLEEFGNPLALNSSGRRKAEIPFANHPGERYRLGEDGWQSLSKAMGTEERWSLLKPGEIIQPELRYLGEKYGVSEP